MESINKSPEQGKGDPNKKGPEDVIKLSNDFKQYNESGQKNLVLDYKFRGAAIEAFKSIPEAAERMADHRRAFKNIESRNGGDWKKTIEDPQAQAIVKEDNKLQAAVIKNPVLDSKVGSIVIPGGNWSKKSQGSLESKAHLGIPLGNIGNPDIVQGTPTDKKESGDVDMSYVEMASGVPYGSMSGGAPVSPLQTPEGSKAVPEQREQTAFTPEEEAAILARHFSQPGTVNLLTEEEQARKGAELIGNREVTINNFSEEEQARKKAEWMRDNPAEASLGSEITVNNFSEAEQAEKKAEWLRAHPEAKSPGMVKPDYDITDPTMGLKSVDIDLRDPNIGHPFAVSDLENEAKKTKMEEMGQVLETRKENTKENLKKMGLLMKGIDAYRKFHPVTKIAIGVGLTAGAVLTGGFLAGTLAAAQKSLGFASMARGFYEKDIAKKTENGEEINKDMAVAKAIAKGLFASVAIGAVLENLGGIMDYVGEKAGSIKEGVATLIDGFKNSSSGDLAFPPMPDMDASATSTTMPPMPDMDASATYANPEGTAYTATPEEIERSKLYGSDYTAPVTPEGDVATSPEMLEAIAGSKPEWVELPEYTIKPGDNLTKIMMRDVIPTIPGAADLTPLQQENMIQNMLKYAANNKLDADFALINQFANPDLIHPGDVIDLNKIREAMTQYNYHTGALGGATLLDHAATVNPSAAIAANSPTYVPDVAPPLPVQPIDLDHAPGDHIDDKPFVVDTAPQPDTVSRKVLRA